MPKAKSERRGGTAGAAESSAALTATTQRNRTDLIMSEARNAGLIGGPKDAIIRGRVSKALVKAARKRAGAVSDTELLELALSNLALADDFGERFLNRKGSVDPDLDLEF